MWVGPLVVKELRRIVESSEITKEDDTNWPKKNIVGKQELEIRVGNDHIAFEVRFARLRIPCSSDRHLTHFVCNYARRRR